MPLLLCLLKLLPLLCRLMESSPPANMMGGGSVGPPSLNTVHHNPGGNTQHYGTASLFLTRW
jgi:hypothetical protein